METIRRATLSDAKTIIEIGRISVEEAHRESCSEKDMNKFLDATYNALAIKNELNDPRNIYHMIFFNDEPAGFSKIILNAAHPNIPQESVTKLDRIYLLNKFFDQKLGYQLLKFNIDLSKQNDQQGMWLFTWVGNKRAVEFYSRAGFVVIGSHRFKVTETHFNQHHQMFLNYGSPITGQ